MLFIVMSASFLDYKEELQERNGDVGFLSQYGERRRYQEGWGETGGKEGKEGGETGAWCFTVKYVFCQRAWIPSIELESGKRVQCHRDAATCTAPRVLHY